MMLDLPLLSNTMQDCGRKLPRTDNVGRTGDWRDLYYLVDYLAFALDRTYEDQPCRAGCSACCSENTVFRVTPAEWSLVREQLEAAEATDAPDGPAVDRMLARNRALFGPFIDQLQAVAEGWATADFDAHNPAIDGLPPGCPALEGDLCALYEVRPLVCRAYGYMAARIRGKESLLICRPHGEPFLASLREHGFDHVPLPNFEPFARQLASLDGSTEIKPLPLWLHEWSARRGARGEEVALPATHDPERGEALGPRAPCPPHGRSHLAVGVAPALQERAAL